MVLSAAPPRHLTKTAPDRILRIAEKLEPQLRDAFLKAFDTLSRQLPLNQLTDLIEAGNVPAIQQLVADLTLPADVVKQAQAAILEVLQTSATDAALGLGMSFTLDNPAVVRWMETHTADLITQVTSETKKAVADIVRRGYTEGVPVRAQARQIRRVVGLTSRDATAVNRFLEGQLDAGIELGRAEKMAQRMSDRLLRRRADNIARTETMTATNQGQLLAWQDAADAELIRVETTRKVWIATGDDRLCPICAVLDGTTVEMNRRFVSNEQASGFDIQPAGTLNGTPQVKIDITGKKPLTNPVSVQVPPAHPSCRCAVGLEFVTAAV